MLNIYQFIYTKVEPEMRSKSRKSMAELNEREPGGKKRKKKRQTYNAKPPLNMVIFSELSEIYSLYISLINI